MQKNYKKEKMIKKTYLKTKNFTKVKFEIFAEGAEKVEILGIDNDWETPIPLVAKKNGHFSTELNLEKDKEHTFKYRINGTIWLDDETADKQVNDGYGGTNSVILA